MYRWRYGNSCHCWKNVIFDLILLKGYYEYCNSLLIYEKTKNIYPWYRNKQFIFYVFLWKFFRNKKKNFFFQLGGSSGKHKYIFAEIGIKNSRMNSAGSLNTVVEATVIHRITSLIFYYILFGAVKNVLVSFLKKW